MKTTITLLCVILAFLVWSGIVQAQAPRSGNSYVNLTRKTTGGQIQPGDVLEIRMTVLLPWGFNGGTIYRARYYDDVPTNTTMLTSTTDSLRIITNEGVTFRRYTLGGGDDAGRYLASPGAGNKQVRINLGTTPGIPTNNTPTSTSNSASININGTYPFGDQPKWWEGHLFTTSFRVMVSGAVGDTIVLGAGEFRYRLSNGGSDQILSTTQYRILISAPQNLCANLVGSNFADGTFGSGTNLNRSTAPSFVIPGYVYKSDMDINLQPDSSLGDGKYAIMKNTSRYSHSNANGRKQPNCTGGIIAVADSCKYRMHEHWDISGDHTGSTTAAGNAPPAYATSAGYMLVVNADYVTSEAYRQTITGLCPNTYYEFSAWVKNICRTCGVSTNLVSTYTPGVYPNLSFEIDDVDRYTTGEIDTLGWIKKGFVFVTGPTQTSMTLSIRNNAPGGGGNDWSVDDITLATCTPNLTLTPSPTAVTCYGNQVNLSCDVRSVFSNYVNWEWERSTDGGTNWSSTGTSGTGSPALVSGEYEYDASYPSFLGDSSSHGSLYRIRVATTPANISNAACSFTATSTVQVMVNNCMWVLRTDVSLTGKIQHSKANLSWTTTNDEKNIYFEIERSIDKINFVRIGRIPAASRDIGDTYHFTDPEELNQPAYYRIKMTDGVYIKYTRIILLSTNKLEFGISSILNPFTSTISLDIVSPSADPATITIIDLYGIIQYSQTIRTTSGVNSIRLGNLHNLTPGMYILQARQNNKMVSRRILKVENR